MLALHRASLGQLLWKLAISREDQAIPYQSHVHVKRESNPTYRYRQVITTSQFCNLTNASERSTHDDSWVIVLLVVVENSLDGCDTGVFLGRIGLSSLCLVPIHDTSNKRRNKESASLSSGNSLNFGEQQGKVAIDLVITLEDARGLNTFPCGSNLDQNTGLVNADSFVKLFLS